jgi:hypothetical protein
MLQAGGGVLAMFAVVDTIMGIAICQCQLWPLLWQMELPVLPALFTDRERELVLFVMAMAIGPRIAHRGSVQLRCHRQVSPC